MSDYISREAAMEIVKRTSGDYAAAFPRYANFLPPTRSRCGMGSGCELTMIGTVL